VPQVTSPKQPGSGRNSKNFAMRDPASSSKFIARETSCHLAKEDGAGDAQP
jgi:hypothetical protein